MRPGSTDPTRFRPIDYYEAGIARFQEARDLFDTDRLGLALTQAGVAAECVLRAFFPPGEVFDSRHDLAELARRSRLRPRKTDSFIEHDSAVATLRRVWRNSYRYMTEDKINAILRQYPAYSAGKGERRALRAAARDAIEAANVLVRFGVNRWTSHSN